MTTIKGSFLRGCLSIEEITIPDNIQIIERLAFFGCDKLREVHLSNNLTLIENKAFAYCESLESIIIPESVIGIEEKAFGNCLKLRDVVFKNGSTLCDMSAFSDCPNLVFKKSYRVGNFNELKKHTNFDVDICPITREKLSDESVAVLLKCGHIFLEIAFAEWEKLRNFCPCCRASFL